MSDETKNHVKFDYNQKSISEIRKSLEHGFNRMNDKLDIITKRQQEQMNNFYEHCEHKREYLRRDINSNEKEIKNISQTLEKKLNKIERKTYYILITGIGLGTLLGYFLNPLISNLIIS